MGRYIIFAILLAKELSKGLNYKQLRESSSVGRARPCQGRGRGFESRLSLYLPINLYSRPGGGIGRHAGLKIL